VRPALLPASLHLWRDPLTLQLGRSGGPGRRRARTRPGLRAVLELLDGSYDRATVLAAAAVQGCDPVRAEALVELLSGAGLVGDAGQDRTPLLGLRPDERERLSADLASLALVRGDGGLPALALRREVQVLVVGAGRVGAPLAVALATAGIGAVDVADDGRTRPQDTGVGGLGLPDVGRPRGQAARELVHRAAPSLPRLPVARPDLVVLASGRDDVRDRARRLVLDGTAHLLVEVREATGVVGPLVLPGRTPCLRCLDLTRSDLDPAWPVLAHQLPAAGDGDTGCDGPLALAVAAQAAMQVLAVVDGTTVPAALGGTLELALPDWRWRRRTWPLHRDCGCGAPPAEPGHG
jgi:hypothetical protein